MLVDLDVMTLCCAQLVIEGAGRYSNFFTIDKHLCSRRSGDKCSLLRTGTGEESEQNDNDKFLEHLYPLRSPPRIIKMN